MKELERFLADGKAQLSRHDPHAALRSLERGLNACSVHHRRELSAILYYLGIALFRLGNRAGALRSWTTSSKLTKRGGYARLMLVRFSNPYGMVRQRTAELDDWKAFYAIQLKRYLDCKHTRKIGSFAEHDMISDLILEYWRELTKGGRLADKSPEEKIELFRQTQVIFPSFVIPEWGDLSVIPVNFARKTRVSASDRCSCGSGLPYMMCCGRTRGEEELLSGSF